MKIKKKAEGRLIRAEERRDEGRIYEYSLKVRVSEEVASYRLPLYSLCIDLTDEYGVKTSSAVENAFVDLDAASSFFDILVENLATPIDLPYILEDELGK